MKLIYIKPAVHGHVIRHPEKMHHRISQEGEWVMDSVHWQRKLMDGDIVLAQPPAEVKEEKDLKPVGKQKPVREGDE